MRTYTTISTFFLLLLLAACTAENAPPAGCEADAHGFIPLATRPLGTDPDLQQPPPTNVPGSSPDCLPATATPASPLTGVFSVGGVRNETLDAADQQLAAAAVGDGTLALAWLTDGALFVSIARGGNRMQARRVDGGMGAPAQSAHMVFSTVNRLHLVYEQDGTIQYRAADQGMHPAQPTFWGQVGAGHNPQVALDSGNRAHVLYEAEGQIWHAAHFYGLTWQVAAVGPGHTPRVTTFHDDPATPGVDEGGFALSYLEGQTLHLRTYGMMPLLLLPGWTAVAAIPLPDLPTGAALLDSIRDENGERLLAAAWVSHVAAPPAPPVPVPPTYMAANPLAPTAVSNPQWVYEQLNAARLTVSDAHFDGGLYQTVSVTPGEMLTFAAYGQGWSSDEDDPAVSINPAEMRLQIGIDPRGGTNPDSAQVVWSATANPLNVYQPFAVSATAVFDSATLFLRAHPDGVRAHNEAYWDAATLSGGSLVNGDFEAPFANGIPTGWTPFYEDAGTGSGAARDRYTVYAVLSADGGTTWSGPHLVGENRVPGQGLTGGIQPQAYPFLSTATETPSLNLFFIYETGDPPPDSEFIRYGRPVVMPCDFITSMCADPPGVPVVTETPPASDLVFARDPLRRGRGLLVWGGLQLDYVGRDVYATTVALR